MDKILLISEETIKKLTVISDNTDGKYITSATIAAQDTDLEPIIGEKLLGKLETLVANNTIGSATAYKNLLDKYITPYLAYIVASRVMLNVAYKVANSGVYTNNDDKKSATGESELTALRKNYENTANAYALKLRNHLQNNSTLYPEYCQLVDGEGAEDPHLCGIVFD